MGLDMRLVGNRFISSYVDSDHPLIEGVKKIIQNELGETLPHGAKIQQIEAEFVYWRKANAIHKWFVDNVQEGQDDCGTYSVSWDHIVELRDICDKIIADPDLGPELLPTTAGFFFGGTSYGESYLDDVTYTRDELNNLLTWHASEKLADREYTWDIVYESSW